VSTRFGERLQKSPVSPVWIKYPFWMDKKWIKKSPVSPFLETFGDFWRERERDKIKFQNIETFFLGFLCFLIRVFGYFWIKPLIETGKNRAKMACFGVKMACLGSKMTVLGQK